MTDRSVFGSVHLGYVVVETDRFADWRRFGRDAIGMHLDEPLPDIVRFRLDEHQCRFLLQRGPAEDVTTLGWQVDDHDTIDEILRRVTRHGVPITDGTPDEAALRGVDRLVRIPGPNGLVQELFVGTRPVDEPLDMVSRGFVTGSSGLGLYFSHLVASMHRSGPRQGLIECSNQGIEGGGRFSIVLP